MWPGCISRAAKTIIVSRASFKKNVTPADAHPGVVTIVAEQSSAASTDLIEIVDF
jgi:hypothetical protein